MFAAPLDVIYRYRCLRMSDGRRGCRLVPGSSLPRRLCAIRIDCVARLRPFLKCASSPVLLATFVEWTPSTSLSDPVAHCLSPDHTRSRGKSVPKLALSSIRVRAG